MIDIKNLVCSILLLLPTYKSKVKIEDDKVELNTLISVKSESKRDTISLWRTSYKCFERLNPGRHLAWKGMKINDVFSPGDYVALHPDNIKKWNLSFGDSLTFLLPNGRNVIKILADLSSTKPKYNNIEKVDWLIPIDGKMISHKVKLILN